MSEQHTIDCTCLTCKKEFKVYVGTTTTECPRCGVEVKNIPTQNKAREKSQVP